MLEELAVGVESKKLVKRSSQEKLLLIILGGFPFTAPTGHAIATPYSRLDQ